MPHYELYPKNLYRIPHFLSMCLFNYIFSFVQSTIELLYLYSELFTAHTQSHTCVYVYLVSGKSQVEKSNTC